MLRLKICTPWGTWQDQSVMHVTLDFGSGHDLYLCEIEPQVGLCADSRKPGWGSLSPSLSIPPLLVLSLSLKINFKKFSSMP